LGDGVFVGVLLILCRSIKIKTKTKTNTILDICGNMAKCTGLVGT